MRLVAAILLMSASVFAQGTNLFISALRNPAKVWTRDQLAKDLYKACRERRGDLTEQEIGAWEKLLESDRVLKTDGSLKCSVHIREIALTCIEELTGESFYPTKGAEAPMRIILSMSVNGEIQRFHVVEILGKDLPGIRMAVRAWISKQTWKYVTPIEKPRFSGAFRSPVAPTHSISGAVRLAFGKARASALLRHGGVACGSLGCAAMHEGAREVPRPIRACRG